MAMGFADAEVAGQAVRTENGIMLIACNGLNYMDNVDPSKSWHIMYSIMIQICIKNHECNDRRLYYRKRY